MNGWCHFLNNKSQFSLNEIYPFLDKVEIQESVNVDGIALQVHNIREEHAYTIEGKNSDVKKYDYRDGLIVKPDPSTRMAQILDT